VDGPTASADVTRSMSTGCRTNVHCRSRPSQPAAGVVEARPLRRTRPRSGRARRRSRPRLAARRRTRFRRRTWPCRSAAADAHRALHQLLGGRTPRTASSESGSTTFHSAEESCACARSPPRPGWAAPSGLGLGRAADCGQACGAATAKTRGGGFAAVDHCGFEFDDIQASRTSRR
jgi:hypothetical protein